MSVEGAIPRNGHLGAIVYGQSALNDIRVEGDANLFATFHQMDPGWAVGEFNTADFRTPKELPSYAMGYHALREMFNYGARFASPMAWNGSNGINAGQPFVKTVSETGFTLLLIGVAVLLTTVIIVLLVGYYLLKVPYDDLVGVASGATGNPPATNVPLATIILYRLSLSFSPSPSSTVVR